MRIEVVHDVAASPDEVLPWVSNLEAYPQWTQLLYRVDADPGDVPKLEDRSPRAWLVELRGKIGPFARSKRLRMVQVPTNEVGHVRFERRERDGLDHGVWKFDVRLTPSGESAFTRVSAVFEYEGRLWSGAIERLLRDEIEASKRRLSELVAAGGQPSDQAL